MREYRSYVHPNKELRTKVVIIFKLTIITLCTNHKNRSCNAHRGL